MSDQHVSVYMAANAEQAHLLRNMLSEAGIASFVTNEVLNGVHFAGGDLFVRAAGGPGFAPTAPRIVVHEDNAEQARKLLLEAEAQMASGEAEQGLSQIVSESDELLAWPLCPECSRPRLATCPVCKTSGTDFDEAFLPEQTKEDDGNQMLVICPTCDEAFAPRFPARCEWCGHAFGDGYELPAPKSLVTPPQILAEFNGRVAILIAGMAAIAAAIIGWFYSLVH